MRKMFTPHPITTDKLTLPTLLQQNVLLGGKKPASWLHMDVNLTLATHFNIFFADQTFPSIVQQNSLCSGKPSQQDSTGPFKNCVGKAERTWHRVGGVHTVVKLFRYHSDSCSNSRLTNFQKSSAKILTHYKPVLPHTFFLFVCLCTDCSELLWK